MTEYLVKVAFWPRAGACPRAGQRLDPCDSVTVEAATDAEAIEKAKTAATAAMESRAYPKAIDTDERRHGVIAYIDRLAPGTRQAVAEDVAFDDDRIDASA